jgi:hypothetical protein
MKVNMILMFVFYLYYLYIFKCPQTFHCTWSFVRPSVIYKFLCPVCIFWNGGRKLKYLAEMLTIMRWCAECRFHIVPVKVTVILYQFQNFVFSFEPIERKLKLFGRSITNNETLCRTQVWASWEQNCRPWVTRL